jgi:hypothetical protein
MTRRLVGYISSAEKRERRRGDLVRMKAKAKFLARIYGYQHGGWGEPYAKLYDHLAHCSGPCCGNPRRWFKTKQALTIQERRVFEATES